MEPIVRLHRCWKIVYSSKSFYSMLLTRSVAANPLSFRNSWKEDEGSIFGIVSSSLVCQFEEFQKCPRRYSLQAPVISCSPQLHFRSSRLPLSLFSLGRSLIPFASPLMRRGMRRTVSPWQCRKQQVSNKCPSGRLNDGEGIVDATAGKARGKGRRKLAGWGGIRKGNRKWNTSNWLPRHARKPEENI